MTGKKINFFFYFSIPARWRRTTSCHQFHTTTENHAQRKKLKSVCSFISWKTTHKSVHTHIQIEIKLRLDSILCGSQYFWGMDAVRSIAIAKGHNKRVQKWHMARGWHLGNELPHTLSFSAYTRFSTTATVYTYKYILVMHTAFHFMKRKRYGNGTNYPCRVCRDFNSVMQNWKISVAAVVCTLLGLCISSTCDKLLMGMRNVFPGFKCSVWKAHVQSLCAQQWDCKFKLLWRIMMQLADWKFNFIIMLLKWRDNWGTIMWKDHVTVNPNSINVVKWHQWTVIFDKITKHVFSFSNKWRQNRLFAVIEMRWICSIINTTLCIWHEEL